MKISIVTPVFNDVRLARALDSIFAQQHRHELETIVIDAGSTDGTREVLDAYRSRISVLISEPDDGIYDGMNKGIGLATGDVVGILNADDQYSDSLVLRDVMEAFEHPGPGRGIDACYGDMFYSNADGKVVRRWRSGGCAKWKWYFGWMPPHPAFFVRKRVYEQYGTLDLRYPIAADYELMLRLLLKNGISVRYLNRIMVNMAPGGTSTASVKNIIKGNLEVSRAWRNNRLRGGHLVPILKPARKIFQLAPLGAFAARRPDAEKS